MNVYRPLTAEEFAQLSGVIQRLGVTEPEEILRCVDPKLGKVYDVWLVRCQEGRMVLKKCGTPCRDQVKYDRYFAGLDLPVPKILASVTIGEETYLAMEYAGDRDARDCTPEEAGRIGEALARIQGRYLAPGGHTELSDYYFREYVADFCGKIQEYFPGFDRVYQKVEKRFFEAPHSLIHDDLLPINVLLDWEQVWIIDWATAGIFPYFLDLARFAFVHSGKGGFYISHEAGMAFLDGYYAGMRKNAGFSVDRRQFYQDVAISAFCQYAMFLYYEEDTEHIRETCDYQYFAKIIEYLQQEG